jgi:hypothetical protein
MSIHYNVKHDALAYFSYDRNVKVFFIFYYYFYNLAC